MPETDASFIRRVLFRLLLGSFVVELLVSEAILKLSRGVDLQELYLDGHNLLTAIASGLVLAIVVAFTTRIYFTNFAREIIDEFFMPVFASVSNRDVVMLAILPGLGEEALFRGALQPLIGIIPASLIFGFLHTGFSKRLLPYSAWTTLVGLLLGALYIWSGNLWGSMVAHAVINSAGVTWVRRSHRSESQAQVRDRGDGAG